MRKEVILLLLLILAISPVLAVYTPGNGVCEREGGENCFVSPDCYPCRVEIRGISIEKNEEVYRIGFEVCNFENREKEFLITASENSEDLLHVREVIPAGGCKAFKFYSVLAQQVIIRVLDPEKEIIYAFEEIAPKEVKKEEPTTAKIFSLPSREILVLFGFPTIILVLFFLIIFFPRKKRLKGNITINYVSKAQKDLEIPPPPIERYAMPLHYFPEWHGSYAPPVEVAQVVIVPKRKVYYLRRKKKDKG